MPRPKEIGPGELVQAIRRADIGDVTLVSGGRHAGHLIITGPDGKVPDIAVKTGTIKAGLLGSIGLKQSQYEFNKKVDKEAHKLGYRRLASDHGAYIKDDGGNVCILVVYVDDLLIIAKSDNLIASIKASLEKVFNITDCGEAASFLGMRIRRDWQKGTLTLGQLGYTKEVLARFGMTDCHPCDTPISTSADLRKHVEGDKPCDQKQ